MAQEIYLGPVESGKGVSTIWHTLQHKRSLCFDFVPLQTQNNWRLRCDCQERGMGVGGDKKKWHRGWAREKEEEVREEKRCSNSEKQNHGVANRTVLKKKRKREEKKKKLQCDEETLGNWTGSIPICWDGANKLVIQHDCGIRGPDLMKALSIKGAVSWIQSIKQNNRCSNSNKATWNMNKLQPPRIKYMQ